MEKYIFISLLVLSLLFLSNPSPIESSTTFFDSFAGGYNQSLWSVRPNYLTPIASSFGIGDNNSTNWSILDSNTTILPSNSIVKFNIKINTVPSDVIFSCKTNFTNDQNYFNDHDLRVFLHSNGTASFDSFINGGGWGGGLFNWNNSLGIHSLELNCTNGIMVLKEDGITLSTVNTNRDFNPSDHVYFGYKNGNSEFANYQLCDSNGCDDFPLTPTPTPTNTPTPTPTNTPTPTPTPTPAGPRKVVFVPGMAGSWNHDALFNCKSTGYSGDWGPWTIANINIYQQLISSLQNAGYNPLPFWYDWRKQVTHTAPILNSFIQTNLNSGETTDVIGYSLGGLIGRAYVEQTQENNRLGKLLTVGSPHQGSVLAYPAWSAGVMLSDNVWFRLGSTMLKVGCMIRYGWSAREAINQMFPSVQNILPTFDYLKDKKTGTMKPVLGMNATNNWLPTIFGPPYFGVNVGTLTGTGRDTLRTMEVIPAKRIDERLGNWIDGKPSGNRSYADGDGTVLTESSQLIGAQNMTLPLDHGGLVSDASGVGAILSFLNGEETVQSFSALGLQESDKSIKPKYTATALLIVVDGASATLTDKDGNQTNDSEGQITIIDPHDEPYSLSIIPDYPWWRWVRPKYRVLVIQLFEDGTSSWKEYPFSKYVSKDWKLSFDRQHHRSDILRDR